MRRGELTEEDKLRMLEIQKALKDLELEKLKRKDKLTHEDIDRMHKLQEEADQLEREILRQKMAMGQELSAEEQMRLQELEEKLGPDDIDTENMHSRITNENNFAELPPVEVMNDVNEGKEKQEEDLNKLN